MESIASTGSRSDRKAVIMISGLNSNNYKDRLKEHADSV